MEDFEISSRNSISDHHDANLPPVDRGKHAYLFLAACFIFEALIWGMTISESFHERVLIRSSAGFTFSYGIFQDYYSTHEPFKSSGDIAVIGTCAMVSQESRTIVSARC